MFCVDAVNPLGPVHEYVAPAIVLALSVSVDPTHIGELLVAAGAAGVVFTVTAVVPADPVHPATVAVTEYVPAAAVVTDDMLGF